MNGCIIETNKNNILAPVHILDKAQLSCGGHSSTAPKLSSVSSREALLPYCPTTAP